MKGIIVFYINFHPEHNQDINQLINIVKEQNKDLFAAIAEMEYRFMLIPCTKEACRVEKIDLDKPYPRYLPKSHSDLAEVERLQEERKKDMNNIRQFMETSKEGGA